MTSRRDVLRSLTAVVSAVIALAVVVGCTPAPKTPEKPSGLNKAMKDVVTQYSAVTTDPNNLSVRYQFDWGDGTQSEWNPAGYAVPDSAVSDTHTYNTTGLMLLRARAQNSKGGTSNWSDTLQVEVVGGDSSLKFVYMYYDPEWEDSVSFQGSLAMSTDGGTVYVTSDASMTHLLSRFGNRKGKFTDVNEEDPTNSPSVSPDGRCYVAYSTPKLFAIQPNGTAAWEYANLADEVEGIAAIDASGNLYFNCNDRRIHSVNNLGQQRWIPDTTGGGASSPAISANGALIFVGGDDSMVHAFNATDGSRAWTPIPLYGSPTSPAIGSDGKFVIGSSNGKLLQIKPDGGDPVWTYDAVAAITASPVIGADGTVYFVSDDGVLHAVNWADGTVKWTLTLGCSEPSTAALSSADILYVVGGYVSADDSLLAINLGDHTRRWSAAIPTSVGSGDRAPLIDYDGGVYVTAGTAIVSFWGRGGPMESPWPMLMHDPQRTGMAK